MNDNQPGPETGDSSRGDSSRGDTSPTQYVTVGALVILTSILLCAGAVWLLGAGTPTVTPPPVSRARVALAAPLNGAQTLTLVGEGFLPGERVEIFFAPSPNTPFSQLGKLAEAAADSNGKVTIANVPAPAGAAANVLYLIGRGSTSGFTGFSATEALSAGQPPQQQTAGPTAVPIQGGANLPDLAIGSVSIEPQTQVNCSVNNVPPQQGVKVDIRNTTPFAAGPFTVVVNNAQYVRNEGLEGGRSLVLWFPGYQTGVNRISVDPEDRVRELSEQNNKVELPLAVPTALPACQPNGNPPPLPPPATPVPPTAVGPTATADPNALNIWYAEYFNNPDIFPNAVIRRYEPGNPYLNLDWRGGSPGAGLPNDNFSGVLTRIQEFPTTDNYLFDFVIDDGGRVYVDNVLLIDEWRNGPQRTVQASRSLTKGPHTIRIEFYDAGGAARVGLSWKTSYTSWRGRYYNNTDRAGTPVLVRDDRDELGGPGINFDWGFSSPAAEVSVDGFSVDWQRTLNFQAGNYVFTADVDDGVRVYIDGAPIIDNYASSGSRVVTATRALAAGPHSIQVQFVEYNGAARLNLSWERLVPPTAAPPPTAPPSATPIPIPSTPTPTVTPVVVVIPTYTPTVPPPPPPPPTFIVIIPDTPTP